MSEISFYVASSYFKLVLIYNILHHLNLNTNKLTDHL